MKINSSEQILSSCKWVNSNLLVFDLFSPIMGMTFPVEIHFDPQDEEKIIRNETIKSIMEFQNLKEDDIDNIYNAVWGYILKYVPEKDRIHKGINSIIEAKLKTIVSGVGFINEDELQYSYFDVHLTAEWDMEHGRTVSYFNGKLDDVN